MITMTTHTELGDRHFSEISGKVEHRQITFKVQYDKNEPLESKVLRQKNLRYYISNSYL